MFTWELPHIEQANWLTMLLNNWNGSNESCQKLLCKPATKQTKHARAHTVSIGSASQEFSAKLHAQASASMSAAY